MKKVLLIKKLIDEGWFDNEKEVESWTILRRIYVNNIPATSCKVMVPIDSEITIKEYYKKKYVNRGGLKLEKAIKEFNINIVDKCALDCGASTGGFTDCLLQNGAKLVYAVDAGHSQLAGKLLNNCKVINMEKTNINSIKLRTLNPVPELISLDLSYLSLKIAIPICMDILHNTGTIVCLVKPIYEVESSEIRRNGNINSIDIIRKILYDLCMYFILIKCNIIGITNSPITGNNGVWEYFIGLSLGINNNFNYINIEETIDKSLQQSQETKMFSKYNHLQEI